MEIHNSDVSSLWIFHTRAQCFIHATENRIDFRCVRSRM